VEKELFPLRIYLSTSPKEQLSCDNLISTVYLKNGKEAMVKTFSMRCDNGKISGVEGSEILYGFE
jgi:hypothetical protein